MMVDTSAFSGAQHTTAPDRFIPPPPPTLPGRDNEWEFNDLAALAARICGARWALLTLLDPTGRCNPLVVGWSGSADDELAPIVALTTELAGEGDSVVVSDMRVDRDRARHPAVQGPPRVRFCANLALTTHTGRRLGVLGVLDPDTRSLSDEQLRRLRVLAQQASTLLTAPQLQQDVDRLKTAMRAVGDDQHARLTLQSIGDGVVTTDRSGRITFLNSLAEHITGWPLADAMGKRLDQVVTLKDEGGQHYVMPETAPTDFPANPLTARSLLVRRDGHEIPVEGTFAPLVGSDRAPTGTVLAFRNVTLARKVAAELNHQATHDPLTGLANRRMLEQRIAHALNTVPGSDSGHALLYLDLDRFKTVNDTAGHVAGDELLRQLSVLLKQHLREADTLARLGGDEFGVLLENCDVGHAEMVAEKLRQTVEQFSFVWKDNAFEIGVSIGLVKIHDASLSLPDLLNQADEACYVAKSQGRNRVHIYDPDDSAQLQHRTDLEWMREVQDALRSERMFLCTQPIVAIGDPAGDAGPRAQHAEVLLRMRATTGAVVPPMAFIPAAERYRLMPELDRWVIGTVLRHIAATPGDDCLYSINLSSASLLDKDFPGFVGTHADDPAMPLARVCFEISETVAIANLNRTIEVIGQLREYGCRFAIDDFGSGMSSFGYLKHLAVDYLKIDGSLVQGVVRDPILYAMVESINRIGKMMGMHTIAEFVEDDAILDALRTMGVDCVQGFGVARPYSIDRAHPAG